MYHWATRSPARPGTLRQSLGQCFATGNAAHLERFRSAGLVISRTRPTYRFPGTKVRGAITGGVERDCKGGWREDGPAGPLAVSKYPDFMSMTDVSRTNVVKPMRGNALKWQDVFIIVERNKETVGYLSF